LNELNVKFTRENATDCYSGTIKHEVGTVITAPDWNPTRKCGNGLHFGEARVGIVNVRKKPSKVFEVEPIGRVVEIEPGKKKAEKLRIIRELDLPQLLSELAKDGDEFVRQEVAGNPNTCKRTLLILAKDKNCYVRNAVAENSNISKRMLSMLAKDRNEGVRLGVARNSNTGKRTLSILAKDADEGVRQEVAGNPNASKRTLSMLAKDKDWYIRSIVAENSNTSKKTLLELATDEDFNVRSEATKNLKQRQN